MQSLEVSGALRPIYGSLGVKRLRLFPEGTEEDSKTFLSTQNFLSSPIHSDNKY